MPGTMVEPPVVGPSGNHNPSEGIRPHLNVRDDADLCICCVMVPYLRTSTG